MKTFFKKQLLLLLLNCLLLLCCVQFKNIKLIVDDQALFGFEVDLSEMEVVLFSNSKAAKKTPDEEKSRRSLPAVEPVQLVKNHP